MAVISLSRYVASLVTPEGYTHALVHRLVRANLEDISHRKRDIALATAVRRPSLLLLLQKSGSLQVLQSADKDRNQSCALQAIKRLTRSRSWSGELLYRSGKANESKAEANADGDYECTMIDSPAAAAEAGSGVEVVTVVQLEEGIAKDGGHDGGPPVDLRDEAPRRPSRDEATKLARI